MRIEFVDAFSGEQFRKLTRYGLRGWHVEVDSGNMRILGMVLTVNDDGLVLSSCTISANERSYYRSGNEYGQTSKIRWDTIETLTVVREET